MKRNSNVQETKSFLINVLYHVGFSKKAIKKIASVSSSDIEDNIVE